ncbi:MAG: helix-turn-helix transcriptional regulator [Pirellulaceae bacterium]|nr:helix-turn-helix transcriptional regulator [Planctomycetales bacterium]MCA9221179.1 helix-turn-helix transcriptional regulator [Planctomycetales bacterium]
MGTRKTNPDFTNGVPELLVLRLLSREPMHGYALVAKIKAATGAGLEFGEGSIYPVLHRLESEGKLSARDEQVNGRSRMVYHVTKDGLAQLDASLEKWNRVVSAVQLALQGG